MISLKDNTLTFAFPEIARQVRALLDEHVRSLVSSFMRPEENAALQEELISRPSFHRLKEDRRSAILRRARSLTETEIEAALRKAASERIDLGDEALGSLAITFRRTLRIPDDGRDYPLPAGLGFFPLRSVDDYPESVPAEWCRRGGVLMPMYQSEALWIHFSSSYPFAVKVAAGKVNAVSGEPWSGDLQKEPQNYLVVPLQPWLDGFSVGEGLIRQFVAMPLGDGYSVEEQLTGRADVGGIQLQVFPRSAQAWFRERLLPILPKSLSELIEWLFDQSSLVREGIVSLAGPVLRCCFPDAMGLSAGGQMRQEIYRDPGDLSDWDQSQSVRCFVHLCHSRDWQRITGEKPPHPPLKAEDYRKRGIPWFDYYRDDLTPLKGARRLAGVKSVAEIRRENGEKPLPGETPITPSLIIQYGNTRRPGEIRGFLGTP